LPSKLRLRIVALLYMRGEMYLPKMASGLGASRALTKIHLKKLESAGIVRSAIAVFSVATIIMELTAGLVSAFAAVALALTVWGTRASA